jgi:hypothetical protein
MLPVRRALASCLLMSLLPLAAVMPLAGQAGQSGGVRKVAAPVLHAFALKHQRASEAIALVHPLLSPRGTVELQPRGNTLVIRDTQAAIDRILPVLKGFDHPLRPLGIEIFIVRAQRAQTSPRVVVSDLPDGLTERLRQILPYEIFRLQAQARLETREGEPVTFELGDDFEISFRVGTVLDDGRIKLNDFRIDRRSPRKVGLLHTHLTLWLDQTMSLGLAKSEASREALMVVMTVNGREPARAGAERRR